MAIFREGEERGRGLPEDILLLTSVTFTRRFVYDLLTCDSHGINCAQNCLSKTSLHESNTPILSITSCNLYLLGLSNQPKFSQFLRHCVCSEFWTFWVHCHQQCVPTINNFTFFFVQISWGKCADFTLYSENKFN